MNFVCFSVHCLFRKIPSNIHNFILFGLHRKSAKIAVSESISWYTAFKFWIRRVFLGTTRFFVYKFTLNNAADCQTFSMSIRRIIVHSILFNRSVWKIFDRSHCGLWAHVGLCQCATVFALTFAQTFNCSKMRCDFVWVWVCNKSSHTIRNVCIP